MAEQQETPSPTEVRKAEKTMSPLQRVMSRARFEIMSHEQDFKAVGVSKEQIEKAAAKAGERVKQEFEQKEKEDPLRRIAQVLKEAAETPEEKLLASAAIENLENTRSDWARKIGVEKERAEYAGQSFDIREMMQYQKSVDIRYTPTQREYYPCVGVIRYLSTREGKIESLDAYKERVLKGLGALKPNQSLDDLRLLPPPRKFHKGPMYRRGLVRAERIPTEISGVRVSVDLAAPRVIFIWADIPTLEKIVNFPRS